MSDFKQHFQVRECPYCNAIDSETIFYLSAEKFCRSNWSYSSEYSELLGIDENVQFNIDNCNVCNFIYAELLPSDLFLEKLYDQVIDLQLAEQGTRDVGDYARRLRYIATLVQLVGGPERKKALDFGSGFGFSSILLNLIGFETISFDQSKSRIDLQHSQGMVAYDDLTEVVERAPYNVIVCDNVLEHIKDIHETVQFFSEILVTDGILYISVPSFEKSVIEKLKLDVATDNLTDMSLNPWEHLNYFDLNHLDGLMKIHGFSPLKRFELPECVDIGLRDEEQVSARIKNGIASTIRLVEYVAKGSTNDSVNSRFYRITG